MAASYRGARFPALIGGLPPGEGVVFAVAGDRIEGLTLPAISGPTLAVVANPRDPSSALLLVLGRDPAEMRDAALTLAVGAKGLAGSVATLGAPTLSRPPALRRPALAAHRPQGPAGRDRRSRHPADRRPAARPGERRLPRRAGPVPVAPRGRAHVAALSLSDGLVAEPRGVAPRRLDERPLPEILQAGSPDRGADSLRSASGGLPLNEQDLSLPPYLLFGQNELQFYFDLKGHATAACQGQQPTNVRSGIDPDTTIDLTGGHHYTQLPNLAFFASAGFPFTRMADLSKTAVVMAPNAGANEIEAFLGLMGRFGDATGAPVTRLRIVRNGDEAALRDHDVLLIGPTSLLTGNPRLMKGAPFSVEGSRLRLRLAPPRPRVLDAGHAAGRRRARAADDVLVNAETFSGMTSFRSPFGGDRVVVALISDRTERLPALVQRLADPPQNAEVKGDLVIESDNTLSSFRVGSTFWVGHHAPLYRAAWWLSGHPVLLALALAGRRPGAGRTDLPAAARP
jgi:cellulose synthase (UDP-forming)